MSFPENTSTSPSGFHLMHSKTHIMAHDLNKKDLEYAVIKEKCQQLIQWQVDYSISLLSTHIHLKGGRPLQTSCYSKNQEISKSTDYA